MYACLYIKCEVSREIIVDIWAE